MAKKMVTQAEATAELAAAGFDTAKLAGFSLAGLLALLKMLAPLILDLLSKQGTKAVAAADCTDVKILADCNLHCAAQSLQSALALHECCCPSPTP